MVDLSSFFILTFKSNQSIKSGFVKVKFGSELVQEFIVLYCPHLVGAPVYFKSQSKQKQLFKRDVVRHLLRHVFILSFLEFGCVDHFSISLLFSDDV